MRRKLIIPFLLVLGLVIYACSDDQSEVLEQQESVLVEQKADLTTTARYVNRSNPRDGVGAIHNEVLREFSGKDLESGMSHAELIEQIKAIIVTKEGRLSAYGITDTGFDAEQVSRVYEDYSNRYANIVAESRLSDSAKNYAQQIIDLTFDPDVTYAGFVDKVNSLENELIASRASGAKSMSDSDYTQMLDLSSIARHSAYLWMMEKPLDGGKVVRGKTRGWIVVGADVLGGIFGGFAGVGYASGAAYYITGAFDL